MPLQMIEKKTKRDQEVFVESWDLVNMFTCLLWLALQVGEQGTEAPFVLSKLSLSSDQPRRDQPCPGIAPASAAAGLILPSVNQGE